MTGVEVGEQACRRVGGGAGRRMEQVQGGRSLGGRRCLTSQVLATQCADDLHSRGEGAWGWSGE